MRLLSTKSNLLPTILVYWMLASTCAASPISRDAPLVTIQNGTLQGSWSEKYNQDFFLGVPYASPPVGQLRFSKPAPPESWSNVRNATAYGPWCLGRSLGLPGFSQTTQAVMSEDCLTVNVIRTAGLGRHAKLPVLAWIHGGGLVEGSAADGRYNGSFIVQHSIDVGHPIIFVSFNYRLGIFGGLSGSPVAEAGLENLFLQDQRQALRWIQDNIAHFGGDAARVTIMGESAGAVSVGGHLLAFGGRDEGLFAAAIAESGGPVPYNSFTKATTREGQFENVLNQTKCLGPNPLQCLRSAPQSILEKVGEAINLTPNLVVDGVIIQQSSSESLRTGRFNRVPLLIGSNRNEGTSFLQQNPAVSSPLSLTQLIQTFTSLPRDIAQNWATLYNQVDVSSLDGSGVVRSNGNVSLGVDYEGKSLWLGDFSFTAGRRQTSLAWAKQGIRYYSYLFDVATANLDAQIFGAAHFQEIPFVFRNLDGVGWEVNPYPSDVRRKERFRKVAEVMSHMWVSFAVTQSPNGIKGPVSQIKWPAYSVETPTTIVFSETGPSVEADTWRSEAIDVFSRYAVELGK